MNIELKTGIGRNLIKVKDKGIVLTIYEKIKNKPIWSDSDVYECFDYSFVYLLREKFGDKFIVILFSSVVKSVEYYYISKILSKHERPCYLDIKKHKKAKQTYMNYINKIRQKLRFYEPFKLNNYE